ncbi:hypothetical protein BDV09DRAFT_139995 [Aspergillus tetrazonus]
MVHPRIAYAANCLYPMPGYVICVSISSPCYFLFSLYYSICLYVQFFVVPLNMETCCGINFMQQQYITLGDSPWLYALGRILRLKLSQET